MKKLFSFILCVALLFTVIPVGTVGAVVNSDIISSNANTAVISGSALTACCDGIASEYTTDQKEVSLLNPSQPNSQNNPYIIENANQLYVLMQGLSENNGVVIDTEGAYFKVADGIRAMYMNGGATLAAMTTVEQIKQYFEYTNVSARKVWADSSRPFKGTFDGNGVVIYGIRSDNTSGGLFPYVSSGATIKNVAVRNSYFSAVTAGGIIGDGSRGNTTAYTINNCEVSNCFIQNSRGDSGAGALVGYVFNTTIGNYVNLLVENCLVYGNTITNTRGKNCTAIGGSFNASGNLFKNSVFLDIVPFDTVAWHTKKAEAYVNCYTDQDISGVGINYAASQLVRVDDTTGEAVKTTMPNLDWQTVWAANAGIPVLRVFHNISGGTCYCGIEYFEDYCALYGHTLGSQVIENSIELTCTTAGSYDKVVYCTVCDREVTRETIVTEPVGHVVETIPLSSECYTVTNNSSSRFSVSGGVYTSTNKSHSSTSTVTIRAVYNCTINMTYSVSSEQNFDYLTIKHNGTQLARISGSVSNRTSTISLSAGDYITVTYSKDGSVNSGSDKGWFSFSCTPGVARVPAETLEPSCTEAVICSVCDMVVYDMLSHIPGEEIEENRIEPTCTTNGSYDLITYCEVCNNVSSREKINIPALGHYIEIYEFVDDCYTISNNSTYPFKYENGVYTSTNKNPSSSSTITIRATSNCTIDLTFSVSSESGWDYLTIKHNTTQLEKISGMVSDDTCNVSLLAGDTITVTYSKDGSINSGYDEGWFSFTCNGVSSTIVPAEDIEATCDNEYICFVCGEAAVEQLSHVEGAPVEENHINATLTEAGSYDEVVYCSLCGEELSRETVIVPKVQLDSNTVLFSVSDATGMPGGEITVPVLISNNPGITCAQISIEYDESIFEVVNIEPLMFDGNLTIHSPLTANPLLVTFADCLKDSNLNGVLANITFKIKDTTPVGTYRLIVDGVQKNVIDISLNDVPFKTIDSIITVVDCVHTDTYTVQENRIEPTCTTEGSYDTVVYCAICDEELSRTGEVIPELGHIFPSDTHPDVMPNPWDICYANSYANIESCQRCSETRTVTIYGSHNLADPVIENYIGATCTEYGSYDEVVYCSLCSYECLRYTIDIEPTGHIEPIQPTPPVLCEDYEFEKTLCTVCGLKQRIIVPGIGHDYRADITEPTCTTSGYTTHTCSRCFDTYVDNYTDALVHDIVIDTAVEPTYDQTGLTEGSHCKNCGEVIVNQEIIPMLSEEISFTYRVYGKNGGGIATNGGYITLEVYMNVDTDIARLSGFCFDIAFNKNLILTSLDYTSIFDINTNIDFDFANRNGVVTIAQSSIPSLGTTLEKGENLLATLIFKVDEDFYNQDVEFTFANNSGKIERTGYKNELFVNFNSSDNISVARCGDIDGNGKINNRDLAILLQSVNGWEVLINDLIADVNNDGETNNRDYALLLQYVNGWNVELQ